MRKISHISKRKEVINQFIQIYHTFSPKIIHWFGVPLIGCPSDLWIYHELIVKIQPDYIIETRLGTAGSSVYKAILCDFLGKGKIISINPDYIINPFTHPRITILNGSALDQNILEKIKKMVKGKKVLVFLDNITPNSLSEELEIYGKLITSDSYLIVENSYKDHISLGIKEFLKKNRLFIQDKKQEKFMLTFNPGGYLLKSKTPVINRRFKLPVSIKALASEQVPLTEIGYAVDKFNRLYYGNSNTAFINWFGCPMQKNPMDLWVYQELIFLTQPDLIIETGTSYGGSAYYMAMLFDILNKGEVVSIDIRNKSILINHGRVTFIKGSSTDPNIVSLLKEKAKGKKVMVVLDSDHSEEHVARELELYSDLVSLGCYLIVEDTNLTGPMYATNAFLNINKKFEADRYCERFLSTFNPSGFLKRIS